MSELYFSLEPRRDGQVIYRRKPEKVCISKHSPSDNVTVRPAACVYTLLVTAVSPRRLLEYDKGQDDRTQVDHFPLSYKMCRVDGRRLHASTGCKPSASQCFSITAVARCLVIKSAGFSEPGTLTNIMLPLRTCSCSQSSCVSMCLIFPRPRLLAIPIAAFASTWSTMYRLSKKSRPIDFRPMASAAPRFAA